MFEEVRIGNDSICYRHVKSSTIFQRFGGGLSWPAASPGFILVLGELFTGDDSPPPLYVFEERHEKSITNMVRLCLTLQGLYHLAHWICDHEAEKEAYLDFFRRFEREERKKDPKSKVGFSFVQPSIPADLGLALQILEGEIRRNALIITQDGILTKRIEQAAQEDMNQNGLEAKYAEIITFTAVVSEFRQSPYNPFAPRWKPSRPPSAMAA